MLTALVVLIGIVAAVALVTALLAHFRSESFQDAAQQEADRLEEQFRLEMDKLEARVRAEYERVIAKAPQ